MNIIKTSFSFFALLIYFSSTALNAQNENLGLRLDVHLGIAHVLHQNDRALQTFTLNGSAFIGISGPNIDGYDVKSPFIHIGLTKPLSAHWAGGLFVEYLLDNAELFANGLSTAHPSNGKTVNHSFPDKRQLRWLNLGTMAFYKIKKLRHRSNRFSITIGTGLVTLMSKNHHRSNLAIDYNSDFDILSKTESFAKVKENLFGIPFHYRSNYSINDRIDFNIGLQFQVYFTSGLDEIGWFTGLSYQLE